MSNKDRSNVATAVGPLRGLHVAIHVLLLPVGLALAMTAIGLIWVFMRQV